MKVQYWGLTKSRAVKNAVRLAAVVSLIATSTAAILLGSTGVAQATPTVVCTWTNASGTPDISIADNWSPNAGQSCGGTSTSTGTATLSGAQLVFPATIPTGGGSPSLDQSESVDDVVFDNFYTIGAGGGTLTLTPSGNGGVGIVANDSSSILAPIALGQNQTFQVASGDTIGIIGTISGAYALTVNANSSGRVDLQAADTYSGGTTVNGNPGGGAVLTGQTSSLGTGPVTVSTGASLWINTSTGTTSNNITDNGVVGIYPTLNQTDTLSGVISGNGQVEAGSAPGQIAVLSGANTYTGGTVVNQGTMSLGAVNAAPGPLYGVSGATFDLAGYSDSVSSLSGSGTITDSGAAATLTDTQTTSTTFSGNITGAVALNMDGSGGELDILGGSADSYTGGTTVTAGELMDGAPAAGFGTGAITVDDNATLAIPGSGSGVTFSNALTLGSSAGGATLSDTGFSTWSGPITLIGTSDTLASSSSLTVSGVISGSVALVTSSLGGGSIKLSAANTYSGGTTVTAGTLTVTNSTGLGSGTATVSGGTGGPTLAIDLATSGTIANNIVDNANISVVPSSGTTTMSGVLSGNGAFDADMLSGTTLVMSGANTFSGSTGIFVGTMSLGAANALTGMVYVGSGTTLDLAGYSDSVTQITGSGTITDSGAAATLTDTQTTSTTFSGNITGAVALNMDGSGGDLTLAGTGNTYSGGATVTAGTLITDPSGLGSASASVASGATLIVGLSNPGTVSNAIADNGQVSVESSSTESGAISGTGIVLLNGPGAILSGADTYTGATTVTGGVNDITGSITSNVTVDTTGTLDLTGSITGNVTVQTGGANLEGSGTVTGSVTTSAGSGNAEVTPGTTAPSPGTFAVTGNVNLSATTSALNIDIAGTTPGSGYSQLVINGGGSTVNVTGASLNVTQSVIPAVGTSFDILVNNGGSAITGTFSVSGTSVPEGGTFAVDGSTYKITYAGGTSGHDVVVTDIANPVSKPIPAPSVSSISPSQGPASGGTSFTITGSNFVSGDGVSFGTAGSATGVTVVSSTEITGTTPSGTGTVNVTVLGPTGASAPVSFTYSSSGGTGTSSTPPPPPSGATSSNSASSTSASGTATATSGAVTATGTGIGGITVAIYPVDPESASPNSVSSPTFFDVAANQGNAFSKVVVQVCNLGAATAQNATMDWYDPTANGGKGAWSAVTPAGSFSNGCLSVTVSSTSSPSIAQLSGTVFGAGAGSSVPAGTSVYVESLSLSPWPPQAGPVTSLTVYFTTSGALTPGTSVITLDSSTGGVGTVFPQNASDYTVDGVEAAFVNVSNGVATVAVPSTLNASAVGADDEVVVDVSSVSLPAPMPANYSLNVWTSSDVVPFTSPPASALEPSGYWLISSNGTAYPSGTATKLGSPPSQLAQPVVGTASTPDGKGYWEVASDGGIFTFGDASFYGSMGGMPLNKPVVGMAATPDGKGYWLVASDGGIFTFGDATFYGSSAGTLTGKEIVVAMAATPDGKGYWLTTQAGQVTAFGDAATFGSLSFSKPQMAPIVAMASTPDGKGYWLVASDGTVTPFGDAPAAMLPVPGTSGASVASAVVGVAFSTEPTEEPWGVCILDYLGTCAYTNAAIEAGQNVAYSAYVFGGASLYRFQWLEEAPGASSFTPISGATASSYTFAGTPATTLGKWSFKVQVTDATGFFRTSSFDTVNVVSSGAPTVTSVSPSSGPSSGGTTVTITGTNLASATGVNFGGTPGTSVTVNSPTSITVTSPSYSPEGGTFDVYVVTPSGDSAPTPGDQFTYISG